MSFAGEESREITNRPEAAPFDSSAQSSNIRPGDTAEGTGDHTATEESIEHASMEDAESSSEPADSGEGEPQLKRPHRGPESDPKKMELKVKPRRLERES